MSRSDTLKSLWETPNYRRRVMAGRRRHGTYEKLSSTFIKLWKDYEWREKLVAKRRVVCNTPEARKDLEKCPDWPIILKLRSFIVSVSPQR